MQSFEFNSGSIFYQVTGTGDPVLLIHGFTLDHRMWEPQVEALSKQYQVIAPDMRGFGKSSVPSGPYAHRDDLAALLRHLNLDSAHAVGLSMGGNIAAEFTLEYPEMARSLVLIDSALTGLPQRAPNLDANALGLAEAKRQWLESDLFASSRKRPDALKALEGILEEYSGWHWLHKNSEVRLVPSPAERLHEIMVPTLVMLGVEDVAWFHSSSDILCNEIRGAKLVTIPEAGHMSNLDNPDAVNNGLFAFYDTLTTDVS